MTMLTAKEHDLALARLEELMDAEPGTPEAAELDALATSIEEYEAHNHPVGTPTAQQAAAFRAEQQRDAA